MHSVEKELPIPVVLKVGISVHPYSRIAKLERMTPFIVDIILLRKTKYARQIEKEVIASLKAYHIKGEFFKYSPEAEEMAVEIIKKWRKR